MSAKCTPLPSPLLIMARCPLAKCPANGKSGRSRKYTESNEPVSPNIFTKKQTIV